MSLFVVLFIDGYHQTFCSFSNVYFLLLFKIVELLVDMDCKGCEKKVRRAISKLDGKKNSEKQNQTSILVVSFSFHKYMFGLKANLD